MTRARAAALAVNVLLSLCVTLGFAAALKGVARWRERHHPRPAVADYLWDWEQKWDGDFYTIRSDVNGWPPWEEFNQDGVRDRSHPIARPDRVERVMFLGDSVTLGDHIEAEEAYPQVLQARLDQAGRPVEDFNIGLWGWSTRQERRAWERIRSRALLAAMVKRQGRKRRDVSNVAAYWWTWRNASWNTSSAAARSPRNRTRKWNSSRW